MPLKPLKACTAHEHEAGEATQTLAHRTATTPTYLPNRLAHGGGRPLRSVDHQVHHHLTQLGGIEDHRGHPSIEVEPKFHVVADRGAKQLDGLLHPPREVHALHDKLALARIRQALLAEIARPLRGLLDDADALPQRRQVSQLLQPHGTPSGSRLPVVPAVARSLAQRHGDPVLHGPPRQLNRVVAEHPVNPLVRVDVPSAVSTVRIPSGALSKISRNCDSDSSRGISASRSGVTSTKVRIRPPASRSMSRYGLCSSGGLTRPAW